MALIICEDCKREISDKSKVCIHCGCPVRIEDSNETEVELKEIFVSESEDKKEIVLKILEKNNYNQIKACKEVRAFYNISLKEAKDLVDKTYIEVNQAKKLNKKEQAKQRIKENKKEGIACCPKCGSTSLSANKKGFGLLKGMVGATIVGPYGIAAAGVGKNKVIVTCLNCGKQFNPGK